jgi:hypothetical protein
MTVNGHRAIAKVKHAVGELECRQEEPNRFAIASSGRKFYCTAPKIEGDALGEDIHSESTVASTQRILGCPIKRPFYGF